MEINEVVRCQELSDLCSQVKGLVSCGEYDRSMELIYRAMAQYPHAPQPHNLLGVVLEKTGNHPCAMKHFRAAWALDPTYCPAGQNLTTYGTFRSLGREAYDERDCPEPSEEPWSIVRDSKGIGRVVRRK